MVRNQVMPRVSFQSVRVLFVRALHQTTLVPLKRKQKEKITQMTKNFVLTCNKKTHTKAIAMH
jgi:hypothetical protein